MQKESMPFTDIKQNNISYIFTSIKVLCPLRVSFQNITVTVQIKMVSSDVVAEFPMKGPTLKWATHYLHPIFLKQNQAKY